MINETSRKASIGRRHGHHERYRQQDALLHGKVADARDSFESAPRLLTKLATPSLQKMTWQSVIFAKIMSSRVEVPHMLENPF